MRDKIDLAQTLLTKIKYLKAKYILSNNQQEELDKIYKRVNYLLDDLKQKRDTEEMISLGVGNHHTLQEIADKMGISKERVRQIEQSALRKLKHPKLMRKIYDYVAEDSIYSQQQSDDTYTVHA